MIDSPHRPGMLTPIAGTLAPLLATLASYQEHIEFWARFAGLCLGVVVSVAAIVRMIRAEIRESRKK